MCGVWKKATGVLLAPTFNESGLLREQINIHMQGFPRGPVVKNPPASAGDVGQFLVGKLRSHMSGGI